MNRKIIVIVSGGDAPGVNAILYGLSTNGTFLYGVHGGFDGLVFNEPFLLEREIITENVSKGKALIQSSRSQAAYSAEGRAKIYRALREGEWESIVVIGGGGSLHMAQYLHHEGFQCVGVPLTVDNDIYGVATTVGYHSGVNCVVEEMKRLRDVGHNLPGRAFLVESLGGNSGHLALGGAIASGADLALIPEALGDYRTVAQRVKEALGMGKQSFYIVLSEGFIPRKSYVDGEQGAGFTVVKEVKRLSGIRLRLSVLGYGQRGGDPVISDIIMGITIGKNARKGLEKGGSGNIYTLDGEIRIADVIGRKKLLNPSLVQLAKERGMLLGPLYES